MITLGYVVFLLNLLGSFCSIISFLVALKVKIVPRFIVMAITTGLTAILWSYIIGLSRNNINNDESSVDA